MTPPINPVTSASVDPISPTTPPFSEAVEKAPAPDDHSQDTPSGWAFFMQMLGPTATKEHLNKIINNLFQQLIQQVRKDEQRAKEAAKKLKKALIGEDPDS